MSYRIGFYKNRAVSLTGIRRLGLITALVATTTLCLSGVAIADVKTDGTVGPATTLTGPNYQVTQELGKTAGQNLFHSFTSFNLNNTESATFSGNAAVQNIISRVTGGAPSDINGLIRSTIGGADFYFVNPAGLLFGPDAQINISGSFYASTADYMALEDGGRFDAIDPAASTLSVAPPEAFGFSTRTPGSIAVNDSLLQGAQSETLFMAGGNIDIVDGNLYAPDGQVVLVSVTSPGEVAVNPSGLTIDGFDRLGTIAVSNPSDSFPFFGFDEGGNIDVTSLSFGDSAGGGKILIRAGEFYLHDGYLRAEVVEPVDGGGLDIETRNKTTISGTARILTRSFDFPANAGPISISTGQLLMADKADIRSDTAGEGSSGTISINANDVTIQDDASISSDALGTGSSDGIYITAANLSLLGDARLKTSTFNEDTTGDAGTIDIRTDNLNMSDEATINSSSERNSAGNAGRIRIESGTISMSGNAWIIGLTETSGRAGTISIAAEQTSLSDGSLVSTSTFSSGQGGTITMTGDSVTLSGDAAIASGTEGDGSGGNVRLENATILLSDSARIAASSSGTGVAGDIALSAADRVEIQGGAISTETLDADGGNISVSSGNLIYLLDGSISTSVDGGVGDGGNIDLDADFLVLNHSDVIANARGGDGGNIMITVDNLFQDDQSTIQASSELGVDGEIIIDTNYEDVSSSLTELPDTLLPELNLASRPCDVISDEDVSSLVVSDRDGLPPSPADYIAVNLTPESGASPPMELNGIDRGHQSIAQGTRSITGRALTGCTY